MDTTNWKWPEAMSPGQQQIIDTYRNYAGDASFSAERLRDLKTRWNGMLPVARLPSELLLLVFDDWASECYAETQNTQPAFRPYAWIRCTHVCRRWRELALASPCLWRRIVPASPAWTQELLDRSRQAPLLVDFNGADAKSGWDVERVRAEGTHHLLRHQFHRIRAAHMDAFDFDNPAEIAAPLLTALRVTGFYENPIAAALFRNAALVDRSPEDAWVFARDGLPALARLDVFTATQAITWSCFRATLQHLRTRAVRPQPSPAAWRTALSAMPRLRTLDIDLGDPTASGTFPQWTPAAPASGTVVLRALHTLTLVDESDGRAAAALLAGLALPAASTVHVELQAVRAAADAPGHLRALLAALAPLTRGCALDDLQADVPARAGALALRLAPLAGTPGMPRVCVCARTDLPRAALRACLAALRDVRVLCVGGDLRAAAAFVRMLQPPSARTAADRTPLFPRLGVLRLLGTCWSPHEAGSASADEEEMFEEDVHELTRQTARMVESRKRAGYEIQCVVLAEKLNEVVVESQEEL